MRELVISKYEAGQRFDKFLAKYMELAPKSFFYKMMRKKNITLNGKKAAGNEKLEKGDTVKLFLSEETIEGFREKKKRAVHTGAKLDILYEDEQVMLINKPAGMLSQKAEKGDISMVEHLISHLLDTGEVTEEMLKTFRPSLCNRLDTQYERNRGSGQDAAGFADALRAFQRTYPAQILPLYRKRRDQRRTGCQRMASEKRKDQPGQNFQKRDKGCQTDPHKIPSACRQWAGDASGDRASDRTYTSDSCPFVLYGTSDLR